MQNLGWTHFMEHNISLWLICMRVIITEIQPKIQRTVNSSGVFWSYIPIWSLWVLHVLPILSFFWSLWNMTLVMHFNLIAGTVSSIYFSLVTLKATQGLGKLQMLSCIKIYQLLSFICIPLWFYFSTITIENFPTYSYSNSIGFMFLEE